MIKTKTIIKKSDTIISYYFFLDYKILCLFKIYIFQQLLLTKVIFLLYVIIKINF